jgi:hypothetical protein
MEDDFNLVLEQIGNSIPASMERRGGGDAKSSGQKAKDAEQFKELLVSNNKDVTAYLRTLTEDQGHDFVELYLSYLTMQLRIAVGLPRSYCPCPPGL